MTLRALLIENDEALGHWLQAVLGEASISIDWVRDVDAATAHVAGVLDEYAVVIVEGVLGGQGVELCMTAKQKGKKTILLVPRGASIMAGVADRILEHPLTRAGFEEAVAGLIDASPEIAPALVEPAPVVVVEDKLTRAAQDRMRLGRAAIVEGNFDAAVIEFDAAAVLLSGNPEPTLLATWARYCRHRQSVRDAAGFRQTLSKTAEALATAEGFFFCASVAHDFGDVDFALMQANRALSVDATHVGAQQLIEILTSGSSVGTQN